MMNFNADGNPTVSALYLVDRGMQGKYYRYYNAETDKWGLCGADMNDALAGKDNYNTYDIVGFFPWVGPLTGPKFDPTKPVVEVAEDKPTKGYQTKKKVAAKRMAKAKLVVTSVGNTKVGSIVKSSGKVTHPDGTVFFRADRNKWIAMMHSKQEAARPTAEACLNFLKKKYNIDGVVIPKE